MKKIVLGLLVISTLTVNAQTIQPTNQNMDYLDFTIKLQEYQLNDIKLKENQQKEIEQAQAYAKLQQINENIKSQEKIIVVNNSHHHDDENGFVYFALATIVGVITSFVIINN